MGKHIETTSYMTKKKKLKPIVYGDELERYIGETLFEAGIRFERPERLDFFLPDNNVFLEIKRFHSERSSDQLHSQDNIILIQGKESVLFFCNILKGRK